MPFELPRYLEEGLLAAGVDPSAITDAKRKASESGDFGAQLDAAGAMSRQDWTRLMAERLGLDFCEHLDLAAIDGKLLEPLNMLYCRRNRLLPLSIENGRLRVATADPLREAALGDLRAIYDAEVDPMVVEISELSRGINSAFDAVTDVSSRLMGGLEGESSLQAQAAELNEAPDLLESDDEAPIIRLINTLIFQAAKDGASDIHVEPFENRSSVRFRVDGLLREVLAPPARFHAALASRVKVMAGMNIAERRLPQDGGIRTRVAGRELDIRVSTVPTSFGERVVMRLLDRSSTLMGLGEIGLAGQDLEGMRRLIRQSHGIVLVTGPTGSGKTTTLYAALSEINSADKNIITIEDPVEYQLRGIGQIQVNPKIDLSFASGLRSVLRQDPDIIMVGEIRDGETARIAVQAALTGHLVFSTLHTNDSFSAITRLLDMGIEPFLISSSLIGVAAQRLVRLLCPQCSEELPPDHPSLAELGIGPSDAGSPRGPGPGCEACHSSGYRGRSAISELLLIDDRIRSHIMNRSDAATIRDTCTRRGMRGLRSHGAALVRAGKTSVAEIARTTSEDVE